MAGGRKETMFQILGLIFLLVMLIAMTHAIITISASSKRKGAKTLWILFAIFSVIGQGAWYFFLLQREELEEWRKWSWAGSNLVVLLIYALFMEVKSNFSLFARRPSRLKSGNGSLPGANKHAPLASAVKTIPAVTSPAIELEEKLGAAWGYLFFVLVLVLLATIFTKGVFFSD